MTRTSPRTSMRGPEEDKRDFHLRGLCRYLPHAGIPPLRVFSGFRVGARNDKNVTPHLDAGSRRGQARLSFTGSLPVFTSCGIPPCGYSLDSASGRGMTRTRHPAPRCGLQKRTRKAFIYGEPVFTSCGIPLLPLLSGFRVVARNDYIQKRASVT